MLRFFQGLSRWLANYTSIFVIGVAVFTFFFPHTFDWVRGTTQTVILGIIMLTMGLTLTTNDFKILAQRPLDVFIGACAQFIIMPGVAYTLVHVWHLDPALSLGILLVGCCPGGVSSNIMSYLCHGDVAFSVGMTCASTILAPVMTPLLMKITAGEIIHVDAVGMFINILIVTIIPVAIGCALNYIYGKKDCFPTIQSLMPGISVTCLAIIVGGVISTVHDDLVARGLSLSSGLLPWFSATTRWVIFWAGLPESWRASILPRSVPSVLRWECRMPVLPRFLLAISLLPSLSLYCLAPSAVPGTVFRAPSLQESI